METIAANTLGTEFGNRSLKPRSASIQGAAAIILLAIVIAMSGVIRASADDQAPKDLVRVSATVEKLEAGKLTIKTDAGQEESVALPDEVKVTRSIPATFADVKAGEFIGCTAVETPNGTLRAKEIHIIPESMRGAGEGHYPWGAPKTTMTNGNIDKLTGVKDGDVIKVSYKGGQTKINVRPSVPVTRIEAASRDDLKPGAKITLFFSKNADGSQTVRFVSIAS